MEEMGFAIDIPGTLLMGFAITVVLCVLIYWKLSKVTDKLNSTYSEVDDMAERVKRLEQTIDRLQHRNNNNNSF